MVIAPLNMLIADDESSSVIIIKNILNKMFNDSVSVHIAESGQQAIELTQGITFDCIFMDYRMPDIDGISAISSIREINKITPIVMTTGATPSVALHQMFIDNGANFIIYKPCRAIEIRDILAKCGGRIKNYL